MDDGLTEVIRREAAAVAGTRSHPRWAEVTSYNKKIQAVKLKVHPEGTETGWVPLPAIAIGNGFGIATGAMAGDLMQIAFTDGDHNSPVIMGRFFSDTQRPPEVEGDEFAIWHKSGTRHVFSSDGTHTATHAKGGTQTWAADGSHATDLKDKPKTLMAGPVTEKVPRKVVTGVVHLATGGMGA